MPKLKAEPGQIKETVIQEKIISAEEQNISDGNNRSDGGPRDLFEFASLIDGSERDEYLLYVYRLAPERSKGYLSKLSLPFDEDTIKMNYGGGTYRLWLKRGSEVRRTQNIDIVGEPKTDIPAAPASSGSVNKSDLQAVVEMIMKNNPNQMSGELMRTAFLNALDIQKAAAQSSQTSMPQTITMLKEMGLIGAPPPSSSPIPEWAMPFIAPLATGLVGLLTKVLEPKDMISEFSNAAAAMTKLKELGGSGGTPKVDYGAELIRIAPTLVDKATGMLAELRKATELRIAASTPAHPTGPVIVQANPSLHTPPPGTGQVVPIMPVNNVPIPQVAVDQQIQNGAPTPEWVLTRVGGMIERNEDPGFVLDFMEENLPPLVDAIRNLSLDELRHMIQQTPEFAHILALPHFEEFVKGFHAKLQESKTVVLAN